MANFPTSLDSLTNPTSGAFQNSPSHFTQHTTANDAIEALEVKVGVNSSAVVTTHDYKLTPRVITLTDGATVTIDLSKKGIHQVTLGGNRTIAVSGETVGQSFVFSVVQDGTGSRTVSWFSTIKWVGGVAPTLTITAGKTDVFGFIVISSGNYLGFIVGKDM